MNDALKSYIKKIVLVADTTLPNGDALNYYHIYFDIISIEDPKGIFVEELIDQNNIYSYKIKPFGFYPSSNNNFIVNAGMAKSTEMLERKMNMFKNLPTSELKNIIKSNNDE